MSTQLIRLRIVRFGLVKNIAVFFVVLESCTWGRDDILSSWQCLCCCCSIYVDRKLHHWKRRTTTGYQISHQWVKYYYCFAYVNADIENQEEILTLLERIS